MMAEAFWNKQTETRCICNLYLFSPKKEKDIAMLNYNENV